MAAIVPEHKLPRTSESGTEGGYNAANGAGYQGGPGAVNRYVTPGGTPGDTSQPAFPVYHRKFANPAPLGLLG